MKEAESIREVAESLGCTKDVVYRSIQKYGIEIRTNKRGLSLRNYKLSELDEGVKAKGIRGYARKLGVDESTLRHNVVSMLPSPNIVTVLVTPAVLPGKGITQVIEKKVVGLSVH